jgi:hypothetical protein
MSATCTAESRLSTTKAPIATMMGIGTAVSRNRRLTMAIASSTPNTPSAGAGSTITIPSRPNASATAAW